MALSSFLLSVFILFCILGIGNSLDCYSCNATASSNYDDPCNNLVDVIKCQDGAVCLSATYTFEGPGLVSKQYTTVKSCYSVTQNTCEKFLKHMKTTNPSQAKIQFVENGCYTCSESKCNQQTKEALKSSGTTLPTPVLFISIFWCILNKLL
ncbi:hypothetical protein NQ317_006615 [Molorchus minor]|uniref:Uncharacterized protein n=1 Tax=Molorchus minor TaxID=1323400 RepID=A0ABQ9K244_9CUCU|nr:hypothetical protein NQ317_006615 [Molorchus minor]